MNYLPRRIILMVILLVSLLSGSGSVNATGQTSMEPSLETARVLARALSSYRTGVKNLASSNPEAFEEILTQAFGEKLSESVRDEVVEMALNRTLPVPARVMFVPGSILGDAEAAYISDEGGSVLISSRAQIDFVSLTILIAEECGHHLDHCLGGDDAKGDEGEIYQRGIFEGGPIPTILIQKLRGQNDHTQIEFEGQLVSAELRFPQNIVRGISSVAKATGRGLGTAARGVGGFTVSVGQGIGTEFSNFGNTVNNFGDAFSYAIQAETARMNGDFEAAAEFERLSNEAHERFESYGSNLLISKVEQALEGVVVDMATGVYHTFNNLGQSVSGYTDAIVLSLRANTARANGDHYGADQLEREAEYARQRSEDAIKRSGRNVLDVATAPGNGYNEITAAMNDTVPGLGMLFDIGLGATGLAPFIIAARGAADIRNAIENNPDNALAAGLTAGAFVAVEAGTFAAGKYAKAAGQVDDWANVGTRARSSTRVFGAPPPAPTYYQSAAFHVDDFVRGVGFYENAYQVGTSATGTIIKGFVPGRDRDDVGELTGQGRSTFGIQNSFSDSERDYVQSPEEVLLELAIEAHLQNFRKSLEEEHNANYPYSRFPWELRERQEEIAAEVELAVEAERIRIVAAIAEFNIAQDTAQLPPPSAPPGGDFPLDGGNNDVVSKVGLESGVLFDKFINGPIPSP